MKTMRFLLLPLLSVLFLASCSDDDVVAPDVPVPGEKEVVVNPACDDNTYQLQTDQPWKAEIADEWVTLYETSGNGSADLKFYTEENSEDEGRTTTLTITFADGTDEKVTIRQKGLAESGSNALGDGNYQKHGVCFGYNGYGKYADANEIKEQVINELQAKRLMEEFAPGELSVATESYEVIENIESSGTSAQDMSESLGVNASLSVDVPCGFSMDIKANYNSEDLANSSKNFSKRRHKRILYRKVMSVENLVALTELDPDCRNKILSLGFRANLNKLSKAIKSNDADVNKKIKDFIGKYGTHIVVAAELGGCFDYSMVTDKSDVSSKTDITAGLDMGYKKMFNIKGDASYDKMNKKIGSNYTCKVTVLGGKAGILSKATNGQMDNTSDDILKWEESITQENSLMIDHKLIPIWNVIPDEETAKAVEQYLTEGKYVKEEPKYELPEPKSDVMGAVKVEISDFMTDVETGNGTLVYTVDAAGSPVAEVCSERIPALGRNRVFVAYPIIEGKPDYSKGFFLGNGVMKPGSLEWNDEKNTYIYKADAEYSDIEKVTTLYIEGNGTGLRFSNKGGEGVEKWATGSMQPSYAKFYKTEGKDTKLSYYNIVKIGKQVWMRENISSPYGVGHKKFPYIEINGKYYYKMNDNFLKTQWSVPTVDAFRQMQSMAATGEPFLKGKSTGFDLDGTGCATSEKEVVRKWNWRKFRLETSVIETVKDAEVETYFLLTAENKLIFIDIDGLEPMQYGEVGDGKDYYYPVRFVRSSEFKYE